MHLFWDFEPKLVKPKRFQSRQLLIDITFFVTTRGIKKEDRVTKILNTEDSWWQFFKWGGFLKLYFELWPWNFSPTTLTCIPFWNVETIHNPKVCLCSWKWPSLGKLAILTWHFDPTIFRACLDSLKSKNYFPRDGGHSYRSLSLKNCNFSTLK